MMNSSLGLEEEDDEKKGEEMQGCNLYYIMPMGIYARIIYTTPTKGNETKITTTAIKTFKNSV